MIFDQDFKAAKCVCVIIKLGNDVLRFYSSYSDSDCISALRSEVISVTIVKMVTLKDIDFRV